MALAEVASSLRDLAVEVVERRSVRSVGSVGVSRVVLRANEVNSTKSVEDLDIGVLVEDVERAAKRSGEDGGILRNDRELGSWKEKASAKLVQRA